MVQHGVPSFAQVMLTSWRLSHEVLGARHGQNQTSPRGLDSSSSSSPSPFREPDGAFPPSSLADVECPSSSLMDVECPVPELAVALSAAVSCLGCRVLVRRVTDTKHYWSKATGCTYAICVLPASHHRPSLAGVTAAGFRVSEPPPSAVGTGLVIDPNFRAKFSTPVMSPRYRCVHGEV